MVRLSITTDQDPKLTRLSTHDKQGRDHQHLSARRAALDRHVRDRSGEGEGHRAFSGLPVDAEGPLPKGGSHVENKRHRQEADRSLPVVR